LSDVTRSDLEGRHLAELHELASARRVPRFRTLRRAELVEAIAGGDDASAPEAPAPTEERTEERAEVRSGVLDLVPDGYGFMRVEGLGRSDDDVYVSRSLVKSFGLRSGDELSGPARPSGGSDRYPSLIDLDAVNGEPAGALRDRPEFEKLTPIPPGDRIPIAERTESLAARMIDLVAAPGHGQRCLIASPAGAGATTVLRELARALRSADGPEPMVVLIDVRPEELTEWRRTVDATIHGASSDSSPEAHVRMAELALERARRLTEQGRDAVVLLDSMTRLARARSLVHGRSRRAARADDDEPAENPAVRYAKRWFSAARNTEEKGSLTIVAAARVGSDSEFEQLVYEVLADSANMELRLDLELARAGLSPPLDVNRSWSHLGSGAMSADEEAWHRALRHSVSALEPADAWQAVAERIRSTATNRELVGA
jgi:transcription termination factor Rho